MEEMKNECRTKAELEQELEALRAENETLQDAKESLSKAVEEMTNSKNYWHDQWNEVYDMNNAYKDRLEKLQHACRIMGDIIGELDIKAVKGKEEA